MSEVLETTQTQIFPPAQTEVYYPSSRSEEEIIYPEQREDDMGETSTHAKLINKIFEMLLYFFEPRTDVFLSPNMNLYYEEGNPNKWYAPDLLIAFGVSNHERSSYQIWKEEIFPQVIFEVASDKTWDNDVGKKYREYERSGVEEYYILDPEFEYLPAPLMAFHRQGERLVLVQITDDKIFSPRLGLEIVRTENTFRLFNPQTKEFLQTLGEAKEKQKIAEEKRKVAEEKRKIAEEKQMLSESRAVAAEIENERLKAEIERLKASK